MGFLGLRGFGSAGETRGIAVINQRYPIPQICSRDLGFVMGSTGILNREDPCKAHKDIESMTTATERAGKRAVKLGSFDFEEPEQGESVVPLPGTKRCRCCTADVPSRLRFIRFKVVSDRGLHDERLEPMLHECSEVKKDRFFN